MAETLTLPEGTSRKEVYEALFPQIRALILGEDDLIANLANISAVLKTAFDFHWIGFYRMVGSELVLGPFQGPLACTRIPLDKGVCGACASQKQTILVPDVNEFPDHIVCSSLSQSEIVVPLVHNSEVKLVLDIDSELVDDFSDIDAQCLEKIVSMVRECHYSSD
jgi:GAF domain-containing protein